MNSQASWLLAASCSKTDSQGAGPTLTFSGSIFDGAAKFCSTERAIRTLKYLAARELGTGTKLGQIDEVSRDY